MSIDHQLPLSLPIALATQSPLLDSMNLTLFMCPESVSTQISFFKNDILVSSIVRFLNCFCFFPLVAKGWVRLLGLSCAEGYKCVDRLLQAGGLAGAGKSLSL